MTNCQSCTAPTPSFLCQRCETQLADMLTALVTGGTITDTTQQGTTASGGTWRIERDRHIPGLLADLADAATGQTRFTTATRRLHGHQQDLHGDMTIEEATKIVNKLLAAGRVNVKASQLIRDIRKLLRQWTEDLTPQAGRYQPLDPHDLAGYAQWLNHHVHTIATTLDSAGRMYNQLRDITRTAHKTIDRPPAHQFCGQCDHMIDRRICGLMLWAPRDATQVTCPNPQCRTAHNINQLYDRWRNNIDHQILPRERIIGNQRTDNPELYDTGIMGTLEEFVSWQQFNRWARERHIKPIRYLRPNGRRGFFRHSPDDIPEYRVGDIRNTRRRMANNKTKTKATT